MSREYIIYSDESTKSGEYFANFYGALLVRSEHIDEVRARLQLTAAELDLQAEIKWSKMSTAYLHRYVALMEAFFDLVADDKIKVRVMFTQTRNVATGLTAYHREHEYHMLYYQFLKHAFGLEHSNPRRLPVRLRLFVDQLPDTEEKNAAFKGYLAGLSRPQAFRAAPVAIHLEDISEVRSHEHILLQCLDVVLGAMQFRLNDKHKEKPAGATTRGKKTIAKEKLYNRISQRIRGIYPHFNIGISTGANDLSDRWKHPYRHWLFKPTSSREDRSRRKER